MVPRTSPDTAVYRRVPNLFFKVIYDSHNRASFQNYNFHAAFRGLDRLLLLLALALMATSLLKNIVWVGDLSHLQEGRFCPLVKFDKPSLSMPHGCFKMFSEITWQPDNYFNYL